MVNPIIQRELVTTLRNPRVFAMLVGIMAVMAALVLARWPSDARVGLHGQQAQQVFRVFGYGMLAAMILLAPVVPATSGVKEKQQGTLSLLINTAMSRWAILFGKLFGVLGVVVLLLLLSLPAAAACVAMGGVATVQLAELYLVLTLTALSYASLGLLVSSLANRIDAALRTTFGLILLLAVGSLGPHQFLQGLLAGPSAALVEWIRCLSPLTAMMELLGDAALVSKGTIGPEGVLTRFTLLSLLLTALSVGLTAYRLHTRIFDKARDKGKVTDEQSTRVRWLRRLLFIIDPQKRSGMIGPLTHPVMVKEFRCRRFGRLHWILRLAGASLVLSLALMLTTTRGAMDWGAADLGGLIVALQLALIVLLTPSMASTLISAEVESRGWLLLQFTPMSSPGIVLGKLLSVAWTLLLVLLATLPCYAVLMYIDANQAPIILRTLLAVAAAAMFITLLSAAVGSLFNRTAAATAAAYAVVVLICFATFLIWMAENAPFSRDVVEAVLLTNPIAVALHLIRAPSFRDYQLLPGHWVFVGLVSAASLIVLMVRVWWISRPR